MKIYKKLVESTWYDTAVLTLGSKLFPCHMENDNIGHTGIKDGGFGYPNPCRNTQKAYLWGSSASLGDCIPQSASKSLPPKPEHRPTSCPAFSLYWSSLGLGPPRGRVWSHCLLLLPSTRCCRKPHGVEAQTPGKKSVFYDGAREQPGLNLAPTMAVCWLFPTRQVVEPPFLLTMLPNWLTG